MRDVSGRISQVGHWSIASDNFMERSRVHPMGDIFEDVIYDRAGALSGMRDCGGV